MAETAAGKQSRPGFGAAAHRAGWQVIAPPGHRPSGRFGGVALAVRADKYSLVSSKHSSSAHVGWLRADVEGSAAPLVLHRGVPPSHGRRWVARSCGGRR
eukprot:3744017-Alexandrium_andersonii.AAC.1